MARPNWVLGAGFTALFRGSLVSNIGDGMRLAAFPLLAASLTSSPFLIGAVTAAQYLPWLVFAPVGGVFVDRWDRRQTILVTQAARGLVMEVLFVLVLAEQVAIWHLCLVAFVITAGEILVDPSVTALVPEVVDDADLDTANGRIASAELITNDFAGAPVGATAFGINPWLPFLIDAASYLGSFVPFRGVPKLAPAAAETPLVTGAIRAEAKEGFDWLRKHPILGPLTVAQVVYYFGLSAGFSQLVTLTTLDNGASSFTFGALLAVAALGAFVGSLAGGRFAQRLGRRTTLAGAAAIQGLTLAAMAVTSSTWMLFLIWFVNGVPAGVQRPVARSLQQRLTPNRLLGRVNVSNRVFTRGVIMIGALTWGTVAETVGVSSSFVVGGAIEVVAAVLIWRALRKLPAVARSWSA